MKRILLILPVLLLFSVSHLFADFQKGLDAYNNGDYATALNEWRPLAEQGNADAQFNLGQMYANGRGVPEDDREAVKWYTLAAEQGDASAQNNLGLMYYFGDGVPEDDVYAYMWFNIASSLGNENATENKQRVAENMTRSQIAEAQALSRKCLNSNYEDCK